MQAQNFLYEETLNQVILSRDAEKRKVTQNLSNASTMKIQLNSIPEKKTSKRETFFFLRPIWETRVKRHRRVGKKDIKI